MLRLRQLRLFFDPHSALLDYMTLPALERLELWGFLHTEMHGWHLLSRDPDAQSKRSTYYGPAIDAINVSDLAEMLSARWMGAQGVAQLKSFRLSMQETFGNMQVKPALKTIRNLRDQGLKLDMHSREKWSTQCINPQMMCELEIDDDEIHDEI
ncbi:hypothetical protein FB451DRAFT_1413186 [Mycena latifolia]|nr:hypothetical protein FB451DRAFT_1413186 [Mycena latifolia]